MQSLSALLAASTPVVIPTAQGVPYYSVRTTLDGRDFGLRFRWNQREERWYLDLRDGAGSLIAAGMKLVCNWPLLRYKKWDPRTPPGELVVVTLSPDRSPPGVDELGVGLRCELTYLAVSG